ncbi:Basic leucine zipper (bZIP) transcription factor atfB [Fusarium oxysporum f. sp. albedinis]|nr:Basic leucine zipper (bZIP) transcription factor atfB [Fusarium oxysporum f. sp. albedinis]
MHNKRMSQTSGCHTLIKNYQQKRIAFPVFDQSPSSIFAPYFPRWKRTAFLICCRFGRRRGDRDESINNLFFILKSSFILTYHPRIRHLELSSPLILPW